MDFYPESINLVATCSRYVADARGAPSEEDYLTPRAHTSPPYGGAGVTESNAQYEAPSGGESIYSSIDEDAPAYSDVMGTFGDYQPPPQPQYNWSVYLQIIDHSDTAIVITITKLLVYNITQFRKN